MIKKIKIVTIDGPSGVGKSTVSRFVASRLGYIYLDTGAMYRGVGLYIQRFGVENSDEKAIASMLENVDIALMPAKDLDSDVGVVLNGEDVSHLIRTPEMSMIASKISALPSVRNYLTAMQREIAEKGKVVAEGRDIGTVVFPQAAYKFFLDAKAEERCNRRVSQLRLKGAKVDEKEILQMILERDKNDSERSIAPLKKADDALLVDTTELTIEQVCQRILRSIEEKSR
jgi:cytidylate kinase